MTAVRLPTRRRDWRLMARTTRLVLSGPAYAALAVVAGLVALTVFVLAQNLTFALDVAVRLPLAPADRVTALLGLFPFLGTSFDATTGFVLVLAAALVGVDVALVVYHLREHGLGAREGGSGLLGVLFATLGAGCAACGPVVLAGLLSLFGVAGALTLLPLEGLELVLVAVAALVLSIYWLADGMRGGEIRGCPVDLGPR